MGRRWRFREVKEFVRMHKNAKSTTLKIIQKLQS